LSLSATDDPPRPSFDSQLSRDMAGYMPARADLMEVSDLQLMCCLFENKFIHALFKATSLFSLCP